MRKVFTAMGYWDFYMSDSGHWNVSCNGKPPKHCAYASPDAIAKLKGIYLKIWDIQWAKPDQE